MYSCPTLNTNNSGEMTLLDIPTNNYTRGGDRKITPGEDGISVEHKLIPQLHLCTGTS